MNLPFLFKHKSKPPQTWVDKTKFVSVVFGDMGLMVFLLEPTTRRILVSLPKSSDCAPMVKFCLALFDNLVFNPG